MIRLGRVSSALAFPEARLRGLGLDPYDPARHADDPCFFIGLYYGDDLAALSAHRGPALVKFCGGDARNGRWLAPALAEMRPRVRTLAPPTLLRDLQHAEIAVDVVHGVYDNDATPFWPRPLGSHVYAYVPYERAEEYGIATLAAVAVRLPELRFLLGRWGARRPPFANGIPLQAWLSPETMPIVYRDCFCGVRTVERDGFPGGPVELALMGRPAAGIISYGVPWIECAPTVDAMVAFIRRARVRNEPDFEVAREAQAHVEDWSFLRLP